jgi:hypothetical protein
VKFKPTVFVQAGLPYLAARSAGYLVGLARTISDHELPQQIEALAEDTQVFGSVDVRGARDLAKVLAVHDVYWVAAIAGFIAWSNQ